MKSPIPVLVKKLQKFVDNECLYTSSQWLNATGMKVFVRKSRRLFDGELQQAFDMANVTIDERYQGNGYFSEFMDNVERLNPLPYIYIENVLNPILDRYCERHLYTKIGQISYYKLTPNFRELENI